MARKTKAELTAEREAARAAKQAAEAEAYPARLMRALEEATTVGNFEMSVEGGYFALRDRDERGNYVYGLSLTHNSNSQVTLEDLEFTLQTKAEERAEAERLSAVRRAAFAKLSEEEKNALGLTDRNNW